MSVYRVRAVRWEHGWELHIENEGVTQVRTLDRAKDQARDYLESLHGRTFNFDGKDELVLVADTPHREIIDAAREHAHAAAELQEQASREMREAVRKLRQDGVSVTDTAALLGVSRGRVSQLADA